jgi:hypothetical protein
MLKTSTAASPGPEAIVEIGGRLSYEPEFHRLSAAVAEGHAAETQARRSGRLECEHELMDQLTGRVPVGDTIAGELG